MINIRDVEDPLFLVLDKEHYNSLYHIIKANIKSVANEQRNTSRDLIDFIDKILNIQLPKAQVDLFTMQ